MKFFKKAVSLLLTAAIMFGMMCAGTVSASADAGSEYVVTALEKDNGAYGFRIEITGGIKESLLVNLRSNILYNHTVTAEYFCENRSYRVIIYYRNRFPDTICYVGDQLTLDKNIMDYSWDTEFDGAEPVMSYIELFTNVPEHIEELKTCYSVKFTCTNSHGLKTVFEDTIFISDYITGDDSSDDAEEEITSDKKDISILKISKPINYTYTGKNRKAVINISDGSYTLRKGTDYTLTYRNCKNIGTASVTIKGKGKYTGEKTLTYQILPKKVSLKAYRNSKNKIVLKWDAVKGADKYQIYMAVGGGQYKKLVTVTNKSTTVTLSGAKFNKAHCEFIVRAVAAEEDGTYYGPYSEEITVRLKK